MIAFFQTLAPFAAVCILCALFARHTALPAALAPLPVMTGTMIYLVLCGYLGFLRLGTILYFVLAAAALACLVRWRKKAVGRVLTPGFTLFCVGGLLLILFLSVRMPVFQEWDEFSLWGPAAKLTKTYDMIYSGAPMGWFWTATQKPGLPTLSYLFNFFGAFAPWRVYAAYDLLMLAAWAAALGSLSWKQWKIAVPAAVLMFLLPYFTVFQRDIYCNFTYLNAYVDIPMGVLMGGGFAWYYHAKKAHAARWPACFAIAGLALCKETALPLAMILAGILAVDLFLCGDAQKKLSCATLLPKFGLSALYFGAPLFCFVSSSVYIGTLGVQQGSVGGASNFTNVQMLVEGTKMLLGLPPSAAAAPFAEKFSFVRANMISAFLQPTAERNTRLTMVGCGLYTMLFILCILAFVCIGTREKQVRRSAIVYGVLSTCGFFAYYIFIGYTYVFVFKENGPALPDYYRYFHTYYVAWLCGALALLFVGAGGVSRYKNCLVGGALALAVGMMLRFGQLVQPQLCVIDYPDVVYDAQRQNTEKVAAARSAIDSDANIYYVNQEDTGGGWFAASYEFIPQMLLYSHGGGRFGDPTVALERAPQPQYAVSLAEWAAELVATQSDYVYLDFADDWFWAYYGSLFSDGGAAYRAGETYVYQVRVAGNPQLVSLDAQDVADPAQELDETGAVKPGPTGAQRYKIEEPAAFVTLVPVEMEAPQA